MRRWRVLQLVEWGEHYLLGGGHPPLVFFCLALVAACSGASREDLLAGKACGGTGECAPGYVCDTASNTCLLEGMAISNSTSVGGGGSGGSGGMTGCDSTVDCPPPSTPCEVPICVGDVCGYSALPMGTNVAMQVGGDCQRRICDGQGNVIDSADPGDLPADGNDCTDDVCNGSDGRQRTCTTGTCVESFALAGSVVAAQVPGDCKEVKCDGAGSTTTVVDDDDIPRRRQPMHGRPLHLGNADQPRLDRRHAMRHRAHM